MNKASAPQRTRRQRGSISADEILGGALKLAADRGVEALSLPKLAAALGIGVASIYWYFPSKDALIDAMTDAAARELHERLGQVPDESWQAHTLALFAGLHGALREDAVLADLVFLRGSRLGESALLQLWPQLEDGLRLMVGAGFSLEEAMQNHSMLSLHMRGAITLARQMALAGSSASAFRPVPDELPHLAEAVKTQPVRGVTDAEYLSHLQRMIAGMEAVLRT